MSHISSCFYMVLMVNNLIIISNHSSSIRKIAAIVSKTKENTFLACSIFSSIVIVPGINPQELDSWVLDEDKCGRCVLPCFISMVPECFTVSIIALLLAKPRCCFRILLNTILQGPFIIQPQLPFLVNQFIILIYTATPKYYLEGMSGGNAPFIYFLFPGNQQVFLLADLIFPVASWVTFECLNMQ